MKPDATEVFLGLCIVAIVIVTVLTLMGVRP